jgi:DNA polymerase III sliding clamp (beta) subunit (PCNA family)
MFTLWKGHCPVVNINQTIIPQTEAVKYLGLPFDCRLNWKEHIARKRKQIDLKTKEINWLIGKKSHLSIENKLLIYKAVIKPIWSYRIELWGCASNSNIVIIQSSQSKILRAVANAPCYVTNHALHTDFNFPYVSDVIHERTNKHHIKLEAHPNPLLEPLLQPVNNRILK